MLCGVLGPLLWLSLIAVAGALQPGFSHVTQYISELAERGSSTETLMRYAAFEFTGFLYLCFALALMGEFRNGRFSRLAACLIALDGLGRIGAGVFPCDPGCVGLSLSQNLHHFFATVGFSSGILATIVWGNYFSDSGVVEDIHWVFGRNRNVGADFSSRDDLEPKSYENTRFV